MHLHSFRLVFAHFYHARIQKVCQWEPNSNNEFFLLFFMRGEWIQKALKEGYHRPASETPFTFRWQADDGPTLNACLVALIFREIWTSIAKKPYIFVIFFQGGKDPLPPPPSGSAHVYRTNILYKHTYFFMAWLHVLRMLLNPDITS